MSPTGLTHGILCAAITSLLLKFVSENGLGVVCGAETGFVVERDPDSVLGADAAFVTNERLAAVEDFDRFLPFAPDLAVEVLSPNNRAVEMDRKIALYFGAGSRAVWVVDPKRRTISVYASPSDVRILDEHDTLDGGEVLPGFSYQLAELFANMK